MRLNGRGLQRMGILGVLILTVSLTGLTLQQTPKPAGKEIRLFNGKDLSGWDYYLADPNAKMEDVWSVDKEQGILICKGSPPGYIYTKQDYTNFILKLEWRWAPGKQPGNSGVLLRVHGEHKIWPRSIEAQLMYMNSGDFWLIDGAPLETDPEFVDKNTPRHRWRKKTTEKPAPEWNEYEIIVNGDRITLKVNGEVVNEGWGAEVRPGKIALQSEGGEIHFRNIRLIPLPSDEKAQPSSKR